MKKTLIILGHPNIKESVANKTICEELKELKNIEIRNIAELYPDFKIDAKAEQEALLNADVIIFQYPIYWLNMTPILKQWLDSVFSYGFAFGSNGYKLENKEMLVSVTVGSGKEGYLGDIMSKILFNMEATAKFCKIKYLEPVVTFGANYTAGISKKEPIVELAKLHAKTILSRIK